MKQKTVVVPPPPESSPAAPAMAGPMMSAPAGAPMPGPAKPMRHTTETNKLPPTTRHRNGMRGMK